MRLKLKIQSPFDLRQSYFFICADGHVCRDRRHPVPEICLMCLIVSSSAVRRWSRVGFISHDVYKRLYLNIFIQSFAALGSKAVWATTKLEMSHCGSFEMDEECIQQMTEGPQFVEFKCVVLILEAGVRNWHDLC